LVIEVVDVVTSLDDSLRVFEMMVVVLTVFPVKLEIYLSNIMICGILVTRI